MWPKQGAATKTAGRRSVGFSLRDEWTEAQRRTAPCFKALCRILSVVFDFSPAVIYFIEKFLVFSLVDDLTLLWAAVASLQIIVWWLGLSLYIYFGSVEDLTALVWIRRRAFPIRLCICIFLAPIVPLVVFGVSFYERRSCSCQTTDEEASFEAPARAPVMSKYSNSAPRTPLAPATNQQPPFVNAEIDEVVAPTKQKMVAGALADDVGEGRIDAEAMHPDMWHSLMASFNATRLNLQFAESAPGHRLFLFSALVGSIPLAAWITVMHAVTTEQDGTFSLLYFTAISAMWVNMYRICRMFSIGAIAFSLLLIRIDALTAGYNLERLMHDQNMTETLFTTMWLIKTGIFFFVVAVLYVIDFVAQVRGGKAKRKNKVWFFAKEGLMIIFHLFVGMIIFPALILAGESLKLTTILVADVLQRPDPEHTPALAGLLSFVFRHTGRDGDTHDARTKHVMLAAARARKEQLIRMARDAPGGEVSPAAISMFKVCSCIEAVASDPKTTAMDIVHQDNVVDVRSGVAVNRADTGPELTRARCLRVLFIADLINNLVGTLLPFLDVFLGLSSWSTWLQLLFLIEIAFWGLLAAFFIPSCVRYARFRLETRRLTQLCPSSRELDRTWLKWVRSYHTNRVSAPPSNTATELDCQHLAHERLPSG